MLSVCSSKKKGGEITIHDCLLRHIIILECIIIQILYLEYDGIPFSKQNWPFEIDLFYITKTRLFKYIENFTTKNWKVFR